MRSKVAVLKRCGVFADCSPDSLRAMSLAGKLRSVARRAPLWNSPELGPLVIRSGVVRESGAYGDRQVTYRFYGRGDLIGAETLLGSAPRSSFEAYEDCVVLDVPLREVSRCSELDGGLFRGLARWEHERVQQLQHQLMMVAHAPAARRLADVLIHLAKRFGVRDSRGTIINLKLTHRELAGLIGATRETVSVTVADFRKRELIHVEGKRFVLLDRRALTKLATDVA